MPTTVQLRNSGGGLAIRSSAYSPPGGWERAQWIVKSDSDRKALEYPADTTGVEEARQFVNAAEHWEQNVLVHQQTFDSCRSLELEQLMWREAERTTGGGFEIGMEYGPGEQEVRCPGGGSAHALATMVRVPGKVEAIRDVTAGTVSIGQKDC
jgi:hypothetical protein